MNKNKKKTKPKQMPEEETFFVGSKNTASMSECTGLIQTPAKTEEEMESYSELYNIPTEEKKYP